MKNFVLPSLIMIGEKISMRCLLMAWYSSSQGSITVKWVSANTEEDRDITRIIVGHAGFRREKGGGGGVMTPASHPRSILSMERISRLGRATQKWSVKRTAGCAARNTQLWRGLPHHELFSFYNYAHNKKIHTFIFNAIWVRTYQGWCVKKSHLNLL